MSTVVPSSALPRAIVAGVASLVAACADPPTPSVAVDAATEITSVAAAARPNVILIVTDDQRWDTIGPKHGIGGQHVMPKVRDTLLVPGGVRFKNAFATTSLCCPSRASILTGQYASHHGVLGNVNSAHGGRQAFVPSEGRTIAKALEAAGYTTALFGKYLNGYHTDGLDATPPGWTRWLAFSRVGYTDYEMVNRAGVVTHETQYSTDRIRDRAVSFVNNTSGPFFLMVNFWAPHGPATPASRHAGSYASVAPWRPTSFGLARAADIAENDQFRRNQLESLQAVDDAVAAIVDTVRARGIENDTVIIFTADNGYAWGEHGLTRKNCPYDECMRVPLIVRYPPLTPVRRDVDSIALNIDLAPTIADLTGVALPGADGVSLRRLLDGTLVGRGFLSEGWPPPPPATPIRYERAFAVVRNLHWKYIESVPFPGGPVQQELYDLDRDPLEQTNVAAGNPDRVTAMRTRLAALRPGWPGDFVNDIAFDIDAD